MKEIHPSSQKMVSKRRGRNSADCAFLISTAPILRSTARIRVNARARSVRKANGTILSPHAVVGVEQRGQTVALVRYNGRASRCAAACSVVFHEIGRVRTWAA